MFEHFIMMASSYKKGTRIAFQLVFDTGIDKNEIEQSINAVYAAIGENAKFSTHYVCTDKASWDSVTTYDPFFSDAYLVDSLDKFIRIMKEDLRITGLDIAKYILSKHPCTHLELEKLAYLCYADFLCKYGKPICADTIYAFKLGPVLKTIYDKYKHSGKYDTLYFEDKEVAKSKLLLDKSPELTKSIDETIKKYSRSSATDLVNITHCTHSPWTMKDATLPYQVIDDPLILEGHHYEEEYYAQHFTKCKEMSVNQ